MEEEALRPLFAAAVGAALVASYQAPTSLLCLVLASVMKPEV